MERNEQEVDILLKNLAKLKMAALEAGTKCTSFKIFDAWWSKHWKERADLELGQQAEVVYMFLLGLLWKEVKNFKVDTKWTQDKGGIDFKLNGHPVQLKTGVMSPEKLAEERAKADVIGARFENILIKIGGEYTDEFYVLEKLVVPDYCEDVLDIPLGDYPEVAAEIWYDFCKKWKRVKDPNGKKENL